MTDNSVTRPSNLSENDQLLLNLHQTFWHIGHIARLVEEACKNIPQDEEDVYSTANVFVNTARELTRQIQFMSAYGEQMADGPQLGFGMVSGHLAPGGIKVDMTISNTGGL